MDIIDSASEQMPEPSDRAFARLAEPFRRKLKIHCYQMLGSLHEAEDAVQEAYLRAWRSFDRLNDRGSIKAWLYRIATNACFDALSKRKHYSRILPDQRAPATNEMPDGVAAPDILWLEPYPDAELDELVDEAPDPEAQYSSRESIRLAFVAAIQQLPPRQRAVLLLCDVLGWSASETAALLSASTASVNSGIQRARETLAKRYSTGPGRAHISPTAAQLRLLDRYMHAWERLDVDGFIALLREDAAYTMPPLPQWYFGREPIAAFFKWAFRPYEAFRMVPIAANGQPAFAAYSRAKLGEGWSAHSIQVIELHSGKIGSLTLFAKPDCVQLFSAFRLPLEISADAPKPRSDDHLILTHSVSTRWPD